MFNLESLCRAYPEDRRSRDYSGPIRGQYPGHVITPDQSEAEDGRSPSVRLEHSTDNFYFQSKILEADIKRPNNYYSSHISGDKTSITILHYPMVPYLPAEIKKFNFWTYSFPSPPCPDFLLEQLNIYNYIFL